MKTFDFAQGSDDWWRVRRGVPTSSEFSNIMTPKKCELAAAAKTYINKLIGDRYDPHYGQVDEYASLAMRNGIIAEPQARTWYEITHGVDVQQVGFCLTDDGRIGCSPDGLVGEDGGCELKRPEAKTHIGYLLAGEVVPDDYKCQVHGSLIVTGRQWWDFISYGQPRSLVVRVYPDEYTEKLRKCLDQFLEMYAEALGRIEKMAA